MYTGTNGGSSSTQFDVYTIKAHSVVATSIHRPLSSSTNLSITFTLFINRATLRRVLWSMSLEYPRRQKAWSMPGRPPPSTWSIAGESDFRVVKSIRVSFTGMGVSFGIYDKEALAIRPYSLHPDSNPPR